VRVARIATLIVVLGVTVNASDAVEPDRFLFSEIEGLAARLTDGFATLDRADTYAGPKRTVLEGHFIVMLAMTSWGGGNGSVQFMAVFRHNDASVRFPDGQRARRYQLLGLVQVGTDSDRWFKSVELRQDRVILTGASWAKGDAHCCPSLDARAVYRFSERGINEVTR